MGLAETYMLINLMSQGIMGTDVMNFFMNKGSGWRQSGDPHGDIVTLRELFGAHENYGKSAGAAMRKNLQKNWPMLLAGSILIPAGFRVGKTLARPALSRANRLLNKSGIGKTVKL